MVDMDFWREYYSDNKNLEKISYYSKYREIVIMRETKGHKLVLRPCKIFKPEHLDYYIKRLNLTENLFDIYHSVASVKIPFPISSNFKKIKEDREQLNLNFMKWITGFDLFIDTDIETDADRPKAREYAISLTLELRKKGYEKTELWDTSRGFHCWNRGRWDVLFIKNLVMDTCCELGIPMSMPIKEINGKRYKTQDKKWVEMKPNEAVPVGSKPWVDVSIYDYRRIKRIPFSLHSKTGKPMVKVQ